MLSDNATRGVERAPNRSLFYALGLTEEELSRPLIGVVSSHNEIVPGHMDLDRICEAVKAGVKRILVNHPQFHIGATYEQMTKWANMGAFIEMNVCVFTSGSKLGTLDDQVIADMLKAVPLDHMILDSDMGQRGNGSPVEGMYRFIRLLMDKFGLSEADINLIAKENPAKLLGD